MLEFWEHLHFSHFSRGANTAGLRFPLKGLASEAVSQQSTHNMEAEALRWLSFSGCITFSKSLFSYSLNFLVSKVGILMLVSLGFSCEHALKATQLSFLTLDRARPKADFSKAKSHNLNFFSLPPTPTGSNMEGNSLNG